MQHTRRESIRELLNNAGFVDVQELVARFGVSSETIRRDLECLEKEGALRRFHGGALSIQPHTNESAYQVRQTYHISEKRAIALLAASLIQDGDTVLIAPGTTALETAIHLKDRQNLTVITNSLPVAMALSEQESIHVFSLGGLVHGEDFSTVGMLTLENLAAFNAAKLIMGIGGITPEAGVTDYRMEESAILRAFIDKAGCIIGIADHSKFGMISVHNICPANRLNHLITDSKTPEDLCRPYREMGVQVHMVAPDAPQ